MAITFYATNNFTGDGTTVNWNINFADGYIDITNVKARYLDNTGSYVDIAISSVAGNVVTISPAVANGQEFQIYRDTEKKFPLVDFSDGAILNETNLDTLATQAVMVSAEAFDQSNNGVRIAGDSLVVAQGIDAKAQLALDNSDAAVATANAIDGKAQTALDSSAAAVTTANAAASTASGAVSTANTALSTANDAAADAATAITTANGAVTTANAATTTANAASVAASAATTTANSAANDAAAAVSTAGTALSTANTASTNASTAITTANAAKATAEGIEAKADSALAASATAVSTANAAEATANAIDGKATSALSTANAADATANAAASTASSAAADASTALSTVTAADSKAQTALDNIVTLDAATMKKAANLSDISDKAAAWLNVRPVGPTPLAADPVGDYDAATKRWVENYTNTKTSWSAVNGDAVAPANGTLVHGGNIISEYDVAGAKKYSAELLSQAQYDTGKSAAVIRATDHISSQTKDLVFETDGTLTVPGAIDSAGIVSGVFLDATGIGIGGGLRRLVAYASAGTNSVNQVYYVENVGSSTTCYQTTIPGQSFQHVWRMDHDGLNKYFSIRSDNNIYTPLGTVAIQGSDVRIKDNFEEPKAGAWSRVKAIGICEFKYKGQSVIQRGFLAQQMGEIDPVYTFEGGTAHDDAGNEFEILNVNDKAVLADVITVIQMMQDKIEAMEAQIAELTSQ